MQMFINVIPLLNPPCLVRYHLSTIGVIGNRGDGEGSFLGFQRLQRVIVSVHVRRAIVIESGYIG